MPEYRIPVNRGKYKSYTSGGKRVKLPNYFVVDNASDFRKLSRYKWQGTPTGYAFTTGAGLGAGSTPFGKRRPTYAHQYISRRAERGIGFYNDATGSHKLEVDHQNRIRFDNRRANLRQVTKVQNIANRGVSRKAFTGRAATGGRRYQDGVSKNMETKIEQDINLFKSYGAIAKKATGGFKRLTPEQAKANRLATYKKRNQSASFKVSQKKYYEKTKNSEARKASVKKANQKYYAKKKASSKKITKK